VLFACGGNRSSRAPDDAPDTSHPDDSTIDTSGSSDAAVDAVVHLDGGTGTPNTVSCYSQNAPTMTCTLPTHCCFSNFDAQHNGTCETSACTWGTISCDGPEDCSSGERCCAHAIIDPDQGLMGYTLACQAGPCGAAPINQELCHPGTCSTGTCVTALGHDNDLPRSLDICQ
jgi:hypothetical protein